MISVNLNSVPEYLKKSKLYTTLSEKDLNEEFLIPEMYFKNDFSVSSLDDIYDLNFINCYWITDDYPDDAIDYILHHMKKYELDNMKYFFKRFYPKINVNWRFFDIFFNIHSSRPIDMTQDAIQCGFDFLYNYFIEREPRVLSEWTSRVLLINGRKDLFQKWEEASLPISQYASKYPVYNDNLPLLKYLVEEKGYSIDYYTLRVAADSNAINCFKYLHEEKGIPLEPEILVKCVFQNSMEVLKYAHEKGCPVNERFVEEIARHGSEEMLLYALDEMEDVPVSDNVMGIAVENDAMILLDIFADHNYVLENPECVENTVFGTNDMLVDYCASEGMTDMFLYIIENYYLDITDTTAFIAAKGCHWEIYEYIVREHPSNVDIDEILQLVEFKPDVYMPALLIYVDNNLALFKIINIFQTPFDWMKAVDNLGKHAMGLTSKLLNHLKKGTQVPFEPPVWGEMENCFLGDVNEIGL